MNIKIISALILGTLILAGCQFAPSKDINEREMYARLVVMSQELAQDCISKTPTEVKQSINKLRVESRVLAVYGTTSEIVETSKILSNDFSEMLVNDYSNSKYCATKAQLIERKASRMLDALKRLR